MSPVADIMRFYVAFQSQISFHVHPCCDAGSPTFRLDSLKTQLVKVFLRIATTQGIIYMKFATTLKVAVAVIGVAALAACQDLKPLQATIDDLKSQVAALKSDTAKAQGDASSASGTAASASQAASGAQSTANQALSAAQASQSCCDATNEKLDRVFKKSVSK
jgi:hypothetical protein